MVTAPRLHRDTPLGPEHQTRAALAWEFRPAPVRAVSSAPVGGGFATIDWLVNVGVTRSYDRTDLTSHAADVADALSLTGRGAALFTAADVTAATSAEEEGVRVDATVGVNKPTWAADIDGAGDADRSPSSAGVWKPGTINLVIQLPVALSDAAAVNAAMTATEAKTQVLLEQGIPGTGTASDAVVVCFPVTDGAEPFGGPRSTWGARLARAVHRAVTLGLAGPRTGAGS